MSVNCQKEECDNCGKLTHQTSRNKERNDNNFCDNSCYGEWRAESINGEHHPKYNKESEVCESCDNANKMRNLKSLCPSCHMEEEYAGET